MREQTKDEAETGKTTATPSQSEVIGTSEKGAGDLPEAELSKISGGITTLQKHY
jgi:hypothetical protein